MKETVLITGANSFIAGHLIQILKENYNIKLLTRSPRESNEFKWDVHEKTIDDKALEGVDYIVHLAGSKLNDGTPLTLERKKLVYESRIGASDFLREELKKRGHKLKAFVSASAIGYYGFQERTLEIDENGKKRNRFCG
ncbi:NAD-dependent epimerase/dehydratase family protein [Chryseobacterium oryctis]|uniref:NAD-dependent epimerase/dehydratase family protein n=1 Tax=Chryseobacterium oryctis TaxID=2952618 RepID=A0ABT3HPP9_9FLAO|nr:NAD-dependent epimerase/dehydratase family protein [Chryseobacterium oryctis]MCW3161756.1 NAD-dependent epimerase/dehydratase family protein [Chryseobacterium oryctis]